MIVERRSHHPNLTKAKRVLKKEKIRSPNDAWKGYLKLGIGEIAKAFRDIALNPTRGFTAPHMNT